MADAPKYEHGQFCWHEVATRDVGAAKGFYEKLLGWSTEDTPMPGGMEGTYTMARVGEGDVAGLYAMDGEHFEGVPPHWENYVWVDDVAATVAKAKDLGATIMADAMDIPDIGSMAVIQDPTGAVINVFKGSGHPGAAQQGMAQGAVGWNELATPDAKAATAFYTQLFGWEAQTGPVPGAEGMTYTTFMAGGQGIAGMMEMAGDDWKGIPPHWMPYITVADCESSAAKVGSLGGGVQVPPQTIPGVGTFSVVADPTGAHFSIMQWDMPAE